MKEMKNNKSKGKKAREIVSVPTGVAIGEIYAFSNSDRKGITYRHKGIKYYYTIDKYIFKSNRRNVQTKLDKIVTSLTGKATGNKRKKQDSMPKKTSVPRATGEIPHGLSRNEFRKFSKSQQDWIEYIKKEEERWNGSTEEATGEEQPQQEKPQEIKELISNLTETLQALMEKF